jgi:ABC-2 type transport system permease protein
MRTLAKLTWIELKLFAREPMALVFTFGFPIVVLVSLVGSFRPNDPAFGGARPADYYLASYVAVVIAAVGLVALPVRLATYRERGVLRRFQATSVPAWALISAQVVVGLVMAALGGAVLVVIGKLAYGASLPSSAGLAGVAFVLSALGLIAFGLLLGSLAGSARSAQAVG